MCCAPCIRPLTGCATAPRTPFRKPSPRPRQPGRESMGILPWDKFPKVLWRIAIDYSSSINGCHVIWSTSDCETSRLDCETSQTGCGTWIVQLASRIVKLAARIVKRVLWNLIFGLWNYKVGLCNSKGGLWNSGVRLWNWYCETLKFHGGGNFDIVLTCLNLVGNPSQFEVPWGWEYLNRVDTPSQFEVPWGWEFWHHLNLVDVPSQFEVPWGWTFWQRLALVDGTCHFQVLWGGNFDIMSPCGHSKSVWSSMRVGILIINVLLLCHFQVLWGWNSLEEV